MTKAQILSDIQNQLLQGNPSDDSSLEWDQLAYWTSYVLNELVTAECNQAIKQGKPIPAVYKKVQDCEVMSVEDVETFTDSDDRMFVELDEDVLNLDNDKGIILVETEDGDEIVRVSLETFHSVKKLRFAKPSISRPQFFRRGEKVYFLGFTQTDSPFEKVNVYYVPKQDLLSAADTTEVLVSSAILPTVIASVVQIGKLQLYGTQIDTANDGTDNKSVQYHTAISNPNQPES
jgi:hypothetical protein